MFRILVYFLGLFLVPFLLMGIVSLVRHRSLYSRLFWTPNRILYAGISGCLLFVMVLFFGLQHQSSDPNAGYVPAQVIDGQLVPPRSGSTGR